MLSKAAWIFCKAFIARLPPLRQQALLRFLPADIQEELKTLIPPETPLEKISIDLTELIDTADTSWLSPFFRTLPQSEIPLYIASVAPATQKKLRKELLFDTPPATISSPARSFMRQRLVRFLCQHSDVIPRGLLPPSPLNALTAMSPEAITIFLHYLGLHDIAAEISQIIDTALLNKIHVSLGPELKGHLATLTKRKEPIVFKKIDFHKWDGSSAALLKVIYHRGLNRLAKALHPESTYLQWHIQRLIPFDEAAHLTQLCKPLDPPEAVSFLTAQIQDLLAKPLKTLSTRLP